MKFHVRTHVNCSASVPRTSAHAHTSDIYVYDDAPFLICIAIGASLGIASGVCACIGAPIRGCSSRCLAWWRVYTKYIYGLNRCPDEDLACHIRVHLPLQFYAPRGVACVQSIVL